MSNDNLECYVVPAMPLPILLPVNCVAEVVKKPSIQNLESAAAEWMKGHANWQNQTLPVLSYTALLQSELSKTESKSKKQKNLIVLNAIPGAARKAYSALLCFGQIKRVKVDSSVDYVESAEDIDKRYVEAVVRFKKKDYIIPKLASLAVAFTYI